MPALVAMAQAHCPVDTPRAVNMPQRRLPRSEFRIVSAVSCPGVTMTSAAIPMNAA
jgi:hypothetical protein